MGIPAPLHYAVRHTARLGQRSAAEAASRSWVIHPAVRQARPRAIFLDGQLDRVKGVQEETSLDFEMARILGRDVEHAATVGFELKDAILTGGSVYAGGARLRLLDGAFSARALRAPDEELDRAAIVCTYVGNRYFGHWVADDCTLNLLAREHATPIGAGRPLYSQEPALVAIWGLQARQVSSARIRKLLWFQDHGQNDSKRERYERLRAPLQARAAAGPRRAVYLRRGVQGARRVLSNQAEIEDRLVRRGFAVVDPTIVQVETVAAQCAGAPAVVSVEGSQLAHGLLNVAANGMLLVLQPPQRFNNVYKDRADCLGIRYGFVIGEADGDGFKVDADEIERTLDLGGIA